MRTQFSINSITLLGRLTKDPEVKYGKNENLIMSFSMATSESIKRGEEYEDITTFHNVVAFGKGGEWLKDKLKKGHQILIIGKQDNTSYEVEGVRKYRSQVIAREITPFFDRKSEDTPKKEFKEENYAVSKDIEDFSTELNDGDDSIPF